MKELQELIKFLKDKGLTNTKIDVHLLCGITEYFESKQVPSDDGLSDYKNEIISAFAFKTGKEIEKLIHEQTENLEKRSNIIEGKILQWYVKTKDEEFAKYFRITTIGEGYV